MLSVRRLADGGMAMVIVSHGRCLLSMLADCVLELDAGRLRPEPVSRLRQA